MTAEPCPQGRTDYEACFAPFRYCPVKGCGRAEQEPAKPGLIGREAVLIEKLAKSLHLAARADYDYTPLRETSDRRGQWFEARLADGRIARVTVVLDRVEEASDGT